MKTKVALCSALLIALLLAVGINSWESSVLEFKFADAPPMTNQERWPDAFAFANKLADLVHTSGGETGSPSRFSGFASVVPNIKDGSVDVYWSGRPPAEYFELERNSPSSMAIRLHRANFNEVELARAAEKAVRFSGTRVVAFAEVVIAAPLPNASGISIGIHSRELAKLKSLADELTLKLGLKVELQYAEEIVALNAPRD